MSARLLVIQHESICPIGRLGDWLVAAGVELDVVRPYAGDALPDTLDHDGLLVLGGTMGANDDDRHPWLGPTRRLLAEAVHSGAPTLGICLGHQLLAVACGGRVQPNPYGATIGLRTVELSTDTGSVGSDPVFDAVPAGAEAIHWNDDVVATVPRGGVVLAMTPDGSPQVIKVGDRAWGVQFHPEADVTITSEWAALSVAAGDIPHARADAHLTDIGHADADLVASWRPWAERFAAVVLS